MKKIYKKVVILAALAIIAGYNVYMSRPTEGMTELMLMNVEALAREELPEFEVVCGQSYGPCWKRGYLCYKGEYWGYNCDRSSDPNDNCSSDC